MYDDVFRQGTVMKFVGGSDHLHIIMNDPAPCPIKACDCIVMAALTTYREGMPHDPSCILDVGDHPFIRHASYVSYLDARVFNATRVQHGVDAGDFQPHDIIPIHAFRRVRDGFLHGRGDQPRDVNIYIKNVLEPGFSSI